MKKNRLQVLFVLVALAALSLTSCRPAATPTEAPVVEPTQAPAAEPTTAPAEPAEAEPVTLRIGTTYIWDTANPTFGWYGYTLRYMQYDTLIEWTEIDTFEPGLAESWDVSDDGLVWTFKIREGVTFHDGTPCTAEDVAWSLNWTIENEIETFSFYLVNFAEIVALDDTTLQVTLSDPVGNMEYLLIYVWILPRSVWEGMTYDDILEFEDLDEVLARANALRYGLAAYVFTRGLRSAERAADALEAGMVGINNFALSSAEAPFGGVKESGIGREGGALGIREFLEAKMIKTVF